ncbi:TMEM175 family protein [Lactococcus garvieae]|uniref:TMEM175 family protein n=1 Tax=Lactococcus garvieae TaxID=1363 RepID=UPI0002D2B474|nr:TMEM175 family protein [Lactococcus garvieae]
MLSKNRLLALTDGFVAIIITILILEIKIPEFLSLSHLLHSEGLYIAAYLLSFVLIVTSWYGHDMLFQGVHQVKVSTFWFNNFYMLTLSLIPFVTGLVGRFPKDSLSVGLYILVILLWYISIYLLAQNIQKLYVHSQIVGSFFKTVKLNIVLLLFSLPFLFIFPPLSLFPVVINASLWIYQQIEASKHL